MQGISLVAENQLGTQGLCAIDWVCNETLKKKKKKKKKF